MSSGSSGSGKSTSTTNSVANPWKGATPYLSGTGEGGSAGLGSDIQGLLPSAYNEIMQNPQPFYPGQTYADFSPESMQSLQSIYARGAGGSPTTNAANAEAQQTLSGSYLNAGNPYFQNMANSIGDTTQQQLASRFASSGRTMGSPAEMQTFSREMANALAPIQYQNYANERNNMMDMTKAAPLLAQNDYVDLNAARQAGAEYDAQQQKSIDEAMQRFSWPYTEPMNRLGTYGNLVMGSAGLGQTGKTEVNTTGSQPGAGPFDYASAGLSTLPLAMMAFMR